jgi:hypothetical protein
MTIIFQSNTGHEIGRWENWEGLVPEKGDIVYDPAWKKSSWSERFINAHVTGRVILYTTPKEIIIYLG